MVKRKRTTQTSEPIIAEAPPQMVEPVEPKEVVETEHEQVKAQRIKSQLNAMVTELEADPLVPMDCEYPREYGEKIYPRYQKFLAQLKELAE